MPCRRAQGVAEHINELGELALFAKYEWIPLSQGPRLQPEVRSGGVAVPALVARGPQWGHPAPESLALRMLVSWFALVSIP